MFEKCARVWQHGTSLDLSSPELYKGQTAAKPLDVRQSVAGVDKHGLCQPPSYTVRHGTGKETVLREK